MSKLGVRREYRHGTRWCVWRWKDIVLFGDLYLRRLHVFQCPWFSVLLHWFYKPDPQPDLHDHPVSFLSVVLRGGYTEIREIGGARKTQDIRYLNFIRSQDKHRIVRIDQNTVTLCFAGPREREWGFHTERGFVPWQSYDIGVEPYGLRELEAFELDWGKMPKPGREAEYFEGRE